MAAFEKQEQRKDKLNQLAQKGLAELYKLSSDLTINSEDLLRILADVQGISPELGKRIDYLWQIRFGKVYYPAPKPEIPESTAFSYHDHLVGKKDPYIDPVHVDLLTEWVDEENYDGALTRVHDRINSALEVHFGGHLSIDPAEKMSVDPRYGDEIPKTRIYELHIIDRYTNEARYGLKYFNGELQVHFGNLPFDKIVAILKEEGFWEL